MIDLSEKIVLVTGGSRGIGAATVRQIVSAGGKAIIHYRANEAAANALAAEVGRENVHLSGADLTSVPETESLWDDALVWKGRIAILINNAGVYERCPLELDLEDWLGAGTGRSELICCRPRSSAAARCRTSNNGVRGSSLMSPAGPPTTVMTWSIFSTAPRKRGCWL